MKCSICEERVKHCDECGEDFEKGEEIKCGSFREHYCLNCNDLEDAEVV